MGEGPKLPSSGSSQGESPLSLPPLVQRGAGKLSIASHPALCYILPQCWCPCRGEQIQEKEFMEIKLAEGWNSESLKTPFLSSQIHTREHSPWSAFPLRERLQSFGRAESLDWPLLPLFATKTPDPSSSVQSWFGSQPSCQVQRTQLEICSCLGSGPDPSGAPPTVQLSKASQEKWPCFLWNPMT